MKLETATVLGLMGLLISWAFYNYIPYTPSELREWGVYSTRGEHLYLNGGGFYEHEYKQADSCVKYKGTYKVKSKKEGYFLVLNRFRPGNTNWPCKISEATSHCDEVTMPMRVYRSGKIELGPSPADSRVQFERHWSFIEAYDVVIVGGPCQ